MLHSLKSIRTTLDYDNQEAAEKLLDLSQVLRYKLYNDENKFITLEEELSILKKSLTVNLDNIHFDIEGDDTHKIILKHTLLQSIQPFFNMLMLQNIENNILILIESQNINVAFTILPTSQFELENAVAKAQKFIMNTFGNSGSLEQYLENELINIQLCLPINNLSDAS